MCSRAYALERDRWMLPIWLHFTSAYLGFCANELRLCPTGVVSYSQQKAIQGFQRGKDKNNGSHPNRLSHDRLASQVLVSQENAAMFVALSRSYKSQRPWKSTCIQDATLMSMNNFGYLRTTLTIHITSTVLTGKRSFHLRKLNVGDYEAWDLKWKWMDKRLLISFSILFGLLTKYALL